MCIIITIIIIFIIINIFVIIKNLNNSDAIPSFSLNFKKSVAARKSVNSAASADVSIDNEAFTEGGEEKKNDNKEENKDEHSDENDDKKRRKTFHDIKEEKQQGKRGGIKAPPKQIIG